MDKGGRGRDKGRMVFDEGSIKPAPTTSRASADERIHPPYKIATLVAAAAQEGLPAATLLDGTGLDAAALNDVEVKTSSRQVALACRNALAAGASPALPFRMGQAMRVSSYGMYGFALLTFKTAREGMQFAQRFHRLAAPTFTLSLQEQGDEAAWVFGDLLGLDATSALHRFLIEFQLVLQTSLAHDIWQDEVRPSLVTLRHAQPAHHALYVDVLGCPALFSQPQDSARFPAKLLDTELKLHNPLTSSMVHRLCERLLAQAGTPSGLARRVYEILAEQPGQFPGMEAVAQRLHTTSRTLRRRLEDEGTTFQAVLNEVRANLAKEYLATTRLSSDDIAVALGFSDTASFRAAFRKWTQHTPAEYRRAARSAA